MNKDIMIYGHFNTACGYGSAIVEYVKAIMKYTDANISLQPFDGQPSDEELRSLVGRKLPDGFGLVFHCIPFTPYGTMKKHMERAGFTSIMTVFEADDIPEIWQQEIKQFNRVIVPSSYARDAFKKHCDNVFVLPHTVSIPTEIIPIDPNKFEYEPDRFRILCISSMVSHRKGLDLLLQAYITAFKESDKTELVIKMMGDKAIFNRYLQSAIEISPNARHVPLIRPLFDNYSYDEIHALYAGCDVHCLLSRGEGFGLPYAESALHGKCNIFPKQGGCQDFMKDGKTGWGCDCYEDRAVTYCIPEINISEFNMFIPSLGNAVDAMREAYWLWKNNPEELKRRGEESKQWVYNQLNPEWIARRAVNAFTGGM